MARKMDESVRASLIEFVGQEFMRTGISARELQQAMHDCGEFAMVPSHVTISSYIQEYKTNHPEYAKIIDSLVEELKGSKIDDPKVIERVYEVANAILNGSTITELAAFKEVSYWVIYRDVHLRLKEIDSKLYSLVNSTLKSRENINNSNISR